MSVHELLELFKGMCGEPPTKCTEMHKAFNGRLGANYPHIPPAAEAFVVYLLMTLVLSLVLHLLYRLYRGRSEYVSRCAPSPNCRFICECGNSKTCFFNLWTTNELSLEQSDEIQLSTLHYEKIAVESAFFS
jgi:hypothetical protein